jgi:hypothetical protein
MMPDRLPVLPQQAGESCAPKRPTPRERDSAHTRTHRFRLVLLSLLLSRRRRRRRCRRRPIIFCRRRRLLHRRHSWPRARRQVAGTMITQSLDCRKGSCADLFVAYLTLAPELRACSIKLALNEAACSLYAAALMRVLPPRSLVSTPPPCTYAHMHRMHTCTHV